MAEGFSPQIGPRWDRWRMVEIDPAELKTDPRWQLIERITASSPFQKSARLRDLLCFLAERTLHGQTQDLSEHHIGSAVFGKPQDYSVVEDSSVRVHVRQLRPSQPSTRTRNAGCNCCRGHSPRSFSSPHCCPGFATRRFPHRLRRPGLWLHCSIPAADRCR